VRFQPSAYAAPPFSPFDGVEGGAGGASADTTGMAVDVAGKFIDAGLDVWQRSADAKADKWRALAAKQEGAKRKKAAKKKAAAAAQQTAMTPAPAVSPVQAAAAMNPMLKWGLVVGGIGLVGFAAYMLLRKKEEPPKPKSNPRRAFIKAAPKRRSPEVKAARTEVPAIEEEVEVEEEDVFSGPEDDGDLAGDDGYAGDDYAGNEEGE